MCATNGNQDSDREKGRSLTKARNHGATVWVFMATLCITLYILQPLPTAVAQERVLEEIVVTAQKRLESLQDVPISVNVTSGEKLEEANIVNLEELSLSTPNLFITKNPLGSFIMIRGIGSQVNQGIEQSVATYSDGIYRGRMQQSRAPFLDIARVEILRGPQSILFGKNTVGGAINLISATPTEEFEGSVSTLYGDEFNEKEMQIILSGPLTDTLGARVAIRDYHIDGYLDNVVQKNQGPMEDELTTRVVMQWEPNDSIDATLRYERSTFDVIGSSIQDVSNYPFDYELETDNDGGQSLVEENLLTQEFVDDSGLYLIEGEFSKTELDETVLNINYYFNDYTLTLITGRSAYNYNERMDLDISESPELQLESTERFRQYSQEIRLTSPQGETFEWITGLFFQYSDIDYDEIDSLAVSLMTQDLITPAMQAFVSPDEIQNMARPFSFDQKAKTSAFFAQSTWNFRDDMRITGGMRYTYERKEAQQEVRFQVLGESGYISCANAPGLTDYLNGVDTELAISCQLFNGYLNEEIVALLPEMQEEVNNMLNMGSYEHRFDRKRSESRWTPSINLQYDFNEDTMIYMSAASGFKGGGFDARILLDDENADLLGVDFEFEDEKVMNYEIGSKMTIANVAELNIAVFHTLVEDLQVSLYDGRTGVVVGNAAELVSQGVELDGRWRMSESLTLMGSLAWLDARYTDYENGGCTVQQVLQYEADYGNRFGCRQDLTDSRVFLSPEWSASLSLIYTRSLSDKLLMNMAVDANFRDNYFLDADDDPNMVQNAYTLFNARVGIRSMLDEWSLSLVGKNLSDKIYSGHGGDIVLTDGDYQKYTAPPRSIALQGTLNF